MYPHARPERALASVRVIALLQVFGSRLHVKQSGLGHLWRRQVGLRASLGMMKTAAEPHCDVLSSGTSRWTPKCRLLSEISGGSGQPTLFLHDVVAGAFHGVSVCLRLLHAGWEPRT